MTADLDKTDNGRRLTPTDLREFTKLLKLKKEYRKLIDIRLCQWVSDAKPKPSLRNLASSFGVSKDTIAKWLVDKESYDKAMALTMKSPTFVEDLQKEIWVRLGTALIALGESPEEKKINEEKEFREILKQRILDGKETYDPEGLKEWYHDDGIFNTEEDRAFAMGISIEAVKKQDQLIIELSKEIQREGKVPLKSD